MISPTAASRYINSPTPAPPVQLLAPGAPDDGAERNNDPMPADTPLAAQDAGMDPAWRAQLEGQDRILSSWMALSRYGVDPEGFCDRRAAYDICEQECEWGYITVQDLDVALERVRAARTASPDASGNNESPASPKEGSVLPSEVPSALAGTAPKNTIRANVEAPAWPECPQFSDEAERGLIECALVRADCLSEDGVHDIAPRHFFSIAHRAMFETVRESWIAQAPLGVLAVTHALRASGRLEVVGGLEAVLRYYTDAAPSSAPHFAEIIRKKAALRDIERGCLAAAAASRMPDADPLAILREQVADVAEAVSGHLPERVETTAEQIERVFDRAERTARGELEPWEVPFKTGLQGLDYILGGGLHYTDLIVIAARTSGGKTALALQLCESAVFSEPPVPCLVLSYEMSADSIMNRLVASVARVPMDVFMSGRWTREQRDALMEAKRRLLAAPITIRANVGDWTIDEISGAMRAFSLRHGMGVVLIDYIQLVPGKAGSRRQMRRDEEIADLTRRTKRLAVSLRLCVLILSQLNDDGLLRESRAIGHDADVFLRLDWGTLPQDENDQSDPEPDPDNVSVSVKKNRQGPRGKVFLQYDGPTFTFIEVVEVKAPVLRQEATGIRPKRSTRR